MITKQIYDKDLGWQDTTVFEQYEIRALQMAGVPDDRIDSLYPESCTKEKLDKDFGEYTYDTFCERKRQAKEQLAKFWRRDTEDKLINLIRQNHALYWIETSATLSYRFMQYGVIPVPCNQVKYLLNEKVTPSSAGICYMHPEQELANHGAWKTLFLLSSLKVYDDVYKGIGGKDTYKITNAKEADSLITSIYGNIFEDQIYEIFHGERNAVERASWFLKNDRDTSIDSGRKAELLNEVEYYLSGDYATLSIHPIPRKYLNTIEDEYGVILDDSKKRIVGINKEKFIKHQSYKIPDTVEFIDDNVFYCNENLKHIDLAKVRLIGCNQFLQTGLEELVIPATVESLGACVCEGCRSLKKVEFLGTLDCLDIASFNGCSSLSEVTLPKDLIGLSDNVFSGTSSLESLTLEEGLRYIGGECFMGSGIKSLDIPKSVIEIAADAYLGREDMQIKIHYPNYMNMPISMLKGRPMPAWFYINGFQEQWILQLLRNFTYVVLVKSTSKRQHLLESYKKGLKDVLKWINSVEIEVEFPFYTLTTALTTMKTESYDIVYLYLSVFNALNLEDWVTNQQNKLAVALMFRSQLPKMYRLIEDCTADDIDKYVEELGKFSEPNKEELGSFIAQCDEHLVFNPVNPKFLKKQENDIDETVRQMEIRNSPVTFPLTHAWGDGPSMTSTVGFIKLLIKDFQKIIHKKWNRD